MRVNGLNFLRHRGFSLIEILITIIVLGIAFTALSVWMWNASIGSADPILSTRAAVLGQAYMDEILAKRFDENTTSGGEIRCGEIGASSCSSTLGSDSGETRSNYDDVDDYHGLVEQPAQDALGNTRNGYDDYRVQISVRYAGTEMGMTNAALKRIQITVTHASAGDFVFAVYRGNF